MKLFQCRNCGQALYFGNTCCERCGLAFVDNLEKRRPLEIAKHRVFYTLIQLRLPLETRGKIPRVLRSNFSLMSRLPIPPS
jgi:hypothetical protein